MRNQPPLEHKQARDLSINPSTDPLRLPQGQKSLLLTAAITGSRYLKGATNLAPGGVPAIPYSVEDAVQTAIACYSEGARLLHVHSRGLDGSHTCDPAWYQEFAFRTRELCPEMKLCFATSRAGAVLNTITALVTSGQTIDPVAAEIGARTAYLSRCNPDFLTAFSATEVVVAELKTDTGHVRAAATRQIARGFIEGVNRVTQKRLIGQEIEITTPQSIDIIESLAGEGLLHGPIHFVLLPNFTDGFPFNTDTLEDIAKRASKTLVTTQKPGLISLGIVLNPSSGRCLPQRIEALRFAIGCPYIHGVRVGIEDAPYWDQSPSRNEELVRNTADFIKSYGAEISTRTEFLNTRGVTWK